MTLAPLCSNRRRYFPNADVVARTLTQHYGDPTHGNKANPLSELLFILCSLQTNEDLYKKTYANLRAAFPSFGRLAAASEDQIASALERGGLARQKARMIHEIMQRLVSDFGRPTLAPLRNMSDAECENYLVSLHGIGLKTARCVMMYSLSRSVFPVDSNCWRICQRLGWVRTTRPDGSCSPRDMDRVQAGIPSQLRFSLHVNFVSHGRLHCRSHSPLCEGCCLRKYCRTGQNAVKTD